MKTVIIHESGKRVIIEKQGADPTKADEIAKNYIASTGADPSKCRIEKSK